MSSPKSRVLIIEDDSDIAELVEFNLKQENITSEIVSNGANGLSRARKLLPDLIILDLMLPEMNGLEVCRHLKTDTKTKAIPIIMLTAKAEEVDRIVGFEVGADDYLTKPFSPRELALRVKAVLKRMRTAEQVQTDATLKFGKLELDPSKHQVSVNKEDINLTAIEFKLLQFLLINKGRVATRDKLLDQVWGYDSALTTRTVDTHIKRLRAKMKSYGDYVETVRGVGYRFKEMP